MSRDGDIVAILSGSCVPIVLRKKHSFYASHEERTRWLQNGSAYQVIGECFIDGRMHGEIFENPLFEDPLNADPLDYDKVLCPSDQAGEKKFERGRKCVYKKRFFHLQ
jgi:hypothetical protein